MCQLKMELYTQFCINGKLIEYLKKITKLNFEKK